MKLQALLSAAILCIGTLHAQVMWKKGNFNDTNRTLTTININQTGWISLAYKNGSSKGIAISQTFGNTFSFTDSTQFNGLQEITGLSNLLSLKPIVIDNKSAPPILMRSDDFGPTYIKNTLPAGVTSITNVLATPPGYSITGGNPNLITLDDGLTWTSTNAEGKDFVCMSHMMAIYGADAITGKIYKSVDTMKTWLDVTGTGPTVAPFLNGLVGFTGFGANPQNIYAFGGGDNLICSDDEGTTWKSLKYNLPDGNYKYFMPSATGGLLIASDTSVYYYNINTNFWEKADNGLPKGYTISGLACSTIDTYYAIVNGKYYTGAYIVGINDAGNTPLSFNIYPVPASDKLYIYNGITGEDIHFSVYSPEGRKLMSIHSASLNLPIDISALSNGVYFVEAHTQDGTAIVTKKLIINR